MFESLLSKTLFLLSISMFFLLFGALSSYRYLKQVYKKGNPYVKYLLEDYSKNGKIVATILLLSFIPFTILMIYDDIIPLNFFLMSLYTFIQGIALGLIFIDENSGLKVIALMAITTLLISLIEMYFGADFSIQGSFLFFSLLGLILVSIFKLFVSIKDLYSKVAATIVIVLFVSFLSYAYSGITEERNIANITTLNNWNTALDYFIEISLTTLIFPAGYWYIATIIRLLF